MMLLNFIKVGTVCAIWAILSLLFRIIIISIVCLANEREWNWSIIVGILLFGLVFLCLSRLLPFQVLMDNPVLTVFLLFLSYRIIVPPAHETLAEMKARNEENFTKTIIFKELKLLQISEKEIRFLQLSIENKTFLKANVNKALSIQNHFSCDKLEAFLDQSVASFLEELHLRLLKTTFPDMNKKEIDEKISLFINFHQVASTQDFNKKQVSLFFDSFGSFVDSHYSRVCERIKKVDLFEIDKMSGRDFEVYLKNCFLNWGYSASLTPATNDYGVDLLLTVEGQKIAVQAKRYKGSVGISAIQEVLGGKAFYQCSHAFVITTGNFTKNAISFADTVGVSLIGRSKLKSLLFIEKSLEAYL